MSESPSSGLRLPRGLSSFRLNELLAAEYDTQLVPGRFFGLDDHIRISATLPESDLTVAPSRVSDAVGTVWRKRQNTP